MNKKIRVLICEDSALMRRTLKKIIGEEPDFILAGAARDGNDAVEKARELKPDVITMDINMPGIDGITALQIINEEKIAPVIMISSLTQEGAETTFEALALGAFDFVPKPGGTVTVDMSTVAEDIRSKIRAAAGTGLLERISRRRRKSKPVAAPRRTAPAKAGGTGRGKKFSYKAVAIGISTGGPKTLFEVLPYLPASLNAAVFLVQHMPGAFLTSYARRIDRESPMSCVEVEQAMVIEPGTIYLARGGRHLTLFKKLNGEVVVRTPNRPEHLFIPSVDVMMSSVFETFGEQTVGVLMTGMGSDGADSMVKIRNGGGMTIAESEDSAIVFGMPREAIERGGANVVVPSWDIAEEIVKAVG